MHLDLCSSGSVTRHHTVKLSDCHLQWKPVNEGYRYLVRENSESRNLLSNNFPGARKYLIIMQNTVLTKVDMITIYLYLKIELIPGKSVTFASPPTAKSMLGLFRKYICAT